MYINNFPEQKLFKPQTFEEVISDREEVLKLMRSRDIINVAGCDRTYVRDYGVDFKNPVAFKQFEFEMEAIASLLEVGPFVVALRNFSLKNEGIGGDQIAASSVGYVVKRGSAVLNDKWPDETKKWVLFSRYNGYGIPILGHPIVFVNNDYIVSTWDGLPNDIKINA